MNLSKSALRTLDLVEHRWTTFPAEALSSVDGEALLALRRRRVRIEWPNPANKSQWRLQPDGWVGALRVSDSLGLRVQPKLGFRHLSTWIAWAAHGARNGLDQAPSLSSEDQLADAVVSNLFLLLEDRLAKGIHRDYVRQRSSGLNASGRPLIRDSLLQMARGEPALVFERTSLTADIEDNRLVRWALHQLAMREVLDQSLVCRLHWLLGFFSSSVRLQPYESAEYIQRTYTSKAEDYPAIHNLCRLLLDGLGPDAGVGDARFGEFTASMWDLFQTSVAVALDSGLGHSFDVHTSYVQSLGRGFMVEPDIVLAPRNGSAPTIVEVKYKDPATGVQNEDVYQAVAYATATRARRAVLVYPDPAHLPGPIVAGNVSVDFVGLDMALRPEDSAAAFVMQLTGHR